MPVMAVTQRATFSHGASLGGGVLSAGASLKQQSTGRVPEMNDPNESGNQSMDEILASIRRIISDDTVATGPDTDDARAGGSARAGGANGAQSSAAPATPRQSGPVAGGEVKPLSALLGHAGDDALPTERAARPTHPAQLRPPAGGPVEGLSQTERQLLREDVVRTVAKSSGDGPLGRPMGPADMESGAEDNDVAGRSALERLRATMPTLKRPDPTRADAASGLAPVPPQRVEVRGPTADGGGGMPSDLASADPSIVRGRRVAPPKAETEADAATGSGAFDAPQAPAARIDGAIDNEAVAPSMRTLARRAEGQQTNASQPAQQEGAVSGATAKVSEVSTARGDVIGGPASPARETLASRIGIGAELDAAGGDAGAESRPAAAERDRGPHGAMPAADNVGGAGGAGGEGGGFANQASEKAGGETEAVVAAPDSPLAAESSAKAVVAARSDVAGGVAIAAGGDASPPTLEDTVAKLLKPMLREWIDDNMPKIAERVLAEELRERAEAAKPIGGSGKSGGDDDASA